VDEAVSEKSTLAQAVRFLHQTKKFIPASVKQADALMDQMIVIGLIALEVRRTPTIACRNPAGTTSADGLVNIRKGGELSLE
jgi:hypothetical protein